MSSQHRWISTNRIYEARQQGLELKDALTYLNAFHLLEP